MKFLGLFPSEFPSVRSTSKHVEARVRRAFEHIARYPEATERVEQRPLVRRLPLVRYPYVIYYEIGAEAVTILRILHGARRQPWSDEEQV